jgi:hypothetical protein
MGVLYRRLILLLILPHVSVIRPSSSSNIVNCILKTNLILGVCILLRVGFNPSTQHHYRRSILLLILPHVSVVRPSSSRTIVNYIRKTILILGVCILLRV